MVDYRDGRGWLAGGASDERRGDSAAVARYFIGVLDRLGWTLFATEQDPRQKLFVELCCGNAVLVSTLAEHYDATAIGLDIRSPDNRLTGVQYIMCDARTTGIKADSADAVCFGTLPDEFGSADLQQMAKETKRILCPGGVVLVADVRVKEEFHQYLVQLDFVLATSPSGTVFFYRKKPRGSQ